MKLPDGAVLAHGPKLQKLSARRMWSRSVRFGAEAAKPDNHRSAGMGRLQNGRFGARDAAKRTLAAKAISLADYVGDPRNVYLVLGLKNGMV